MNPRRVLALARPRTAGVVAAFAAALPWHAVAAEATACAPPQRALFACSVGAKVVAVCASPDLAADAGRVQYRFGRPDALDLAYPPADADWRTLTRGGTLVYSGGGGAFLAFARAPYRYVVYTAVGQGWGSRAGVVVEKGGRRIANLACKGEVTSELGPDLFTRAGIAEAETAFELP